MEASAPEETGADADLPGPPRGSNELLGVADEDDQVSEGAQRKGELLLRLTFTCLQMEEFLGPQGEYNEEEEERKYYRRKRLGVIKNVVAASLGAMMVYSVYMGE